MKVKNIGVMLDRVVIERAVRGKPTYERLHLYADIGKELGLRPVFFHPKDVDVSSRRVRGYVWNGKQLVRKSVVLPSVVHNRVLSGRRPTNEKLRRIARVAKVYNGRVPRNKLKVYQLLWRNPAIRPYLPETVVFQPALVEKFLKRYPVVYVKPAAGSVGRGVVRLERKPNGQVEWISARRRTGFSLSRLRGEMARWVEKRRFLIQRGVPLAGYNGRPFDIRVSVQKNGEGKWVVSGMVAKVANPRNMLSNLAQGGKAVPLDKALSTQFGAEERQKVKERLERAALLIASELERHSRMLADLGLDMGVDGTGHPFLIEVNIRDQRYSFFKAGESRLFERTYRHPLEYGCRLLGTR